MLAPIRKVRFGGVSITLRADLLACIEYSDVAEGASLEAAALALQPEHDGEKGVVVSKCSDPRVWSDLFFAFSASWRDESGWNAEHSARADDPLIHPRKRQRYVDLAKLVSHREFTQLRQVLWGLLLEAVLPPGETATENAGDEPRSEA